MISPSCVSPQSRGCFRTLPRPPRTSSAWRLLRPELKLKKRQGPQGRSNSGRPPRVLLVLSPLDLSRRCPSIHSPPPPAPPPPHQPM
eukprot:5546304-Pyramimonas_sp.AAC.1